MKNVINNEEWSEIYFKLQEKRRNYSGPTDVRVLLGENNYPPILDKIDFTTTRNLSNLHFKDVIITKCKFHKNIFNKTYFSQVIFKNCTIEEIDLDESVIGGCLFQRCEFSGLRTSLSGISETLFTDSKLTLSHFQNSVFSDVIFIRSNLSSSDFIKCNFQNTFFSFSDLSHSSWLLCDLKEMNICHGALHGACFWKNTYQNVSWMESDLAECLMLENSGEPQTLNCTAWNVTKPIVGVSWNFNARTDYAPIIAQALRATGAILLKIEMDPEDISNDLLQKEIITLMPTLKEKFLSEILSIPEEMLKKAQDESEMGKIRSKTFLILQYCNGLALPGGPDLQPEFYAAEKAPKTDQVKDYRRSMIEFALLFWADKLQLPTMGTCRGAQLINVYFGGTLKQHVENQYLHERPQLTQVSASSRKEEFLSYFGSDLFPSTSLHHQAVDKVGRNLEVICEYEGIPKLLLSPNNQFIASQIHPEIFVCIDRFPENFRPAQCGELIYKLFFQKIQEFWDCSVNGTLLSP